VEPSNPDSAALPQPLIWARSVQGTASPAHYPRPLPSLARHRLAADHRKGRRSESDWCPDRCAAAHRGDKRSRSFVMLVTFFSSYPADLGERSTRAFVAHHPKGARAADGVLEQLELHQIADLEVVERRPFLQIAAMEVHLSALRQPDEPVALTDQNSDNPPGFRLAGELGRLIRPLRFLWPHPIRIVEVSAEGPPETIEPCPPRRGAARPPRH
jgi:hypothetical protein